MFFTLMKQSAVDSNAGATIEALANVHSLSGTSIREDLSQSRAAFQAKSSDRQAAADRAAAASAELKTSTRTLRASISMASQYGTAIGDDRLSAVELGDDVEHDLICSDTTQDILQTLPHSLARELGIQLAAASTRVRSARSAVFASKPVLARLDKEWNAEAKLLTSLTNHGRALAKGSGLKLPQKEALRRPRAPKTTVTESSGGKPKPATPTTPGVPQTTVVPTTETSPTGAQA